MNPLITVFPLLIVSAAVTYGVFRALGRVWLENKVRLALLEKLQDKPELVENFREVQGLLAGMDVAKHARTRQDYTLTGVLLSIIGLGCTFLGRGIGVGRLAVGVYVGGLACIALGVVLAFMGLLIRLMARSISH